MSKRVLTKEQIFGASDTSLTEFVGCPEWGHIMADDDTPEDLRDADGFLLEVYEDYRGRPDKRRVPMGVFVRALSVKERGEARRAASSDVKTPSGIKSETDMEQMECLLVTSCAVDEDGKPIFNKIDFEALLEKAGGPVNRIARRAMKMAGMLMDDDDLGN